MMQAAIKFGVLAQLGEHLPYKQRVTGSSPVGPTHAQIAQLVEQWTENPCVAGSIPALGTNGEAGTEMYRLFSIVLT